MHARVCTVTRVLLVPRVTPTFIDASAALVAQIGNDPDEGLYIEVSPRGNVFHAEMVVRSLTFQLAPLSVPSDLFGRD